MFGLQKLAAVFGAVLVLASGYYFYQSQAGTSIGLTLTTNPNLENGLLAHYTFDGPDIDWSSTTAEFLDSSGNGVHGDATASGDNMNAGQVTAGNIGQGMEFVAVEGQGLVVPSSVGLTWASGTASVWFNTSADFSTNDGVFFYASPPWGGGNGFGDEDELHMHINDGNPTAGNLNTLGLYMRGASPQEIITTFTVNDGEWHHALMRWDGVGGVDLFHNGILVGNAVKTATTSPINHTTFGRIYGGARSFNGSLDDARLYNRALSDDEVKRLYQLGATTKINQTLDSNTTLETGLVGHDSVPPQSD